MSTHVLSEKILKDTKVKVMTVAGLMALTVATHYGWILEPIFGHQSWIHAIHSRLCYVPIVIAASWFGLRGGLLSAAAITILVVPYVFFLGGMGDMSEEIVEIVFYFALGGLIGGLIDRDLIIRKKKEDAELKLERAQKLSLIGQMAAGVAHEIKNPLASIKGALEIVSDPKTDAKDKMEFQQIASNEIKRVDSTIKEFLAFARPKETRMERMDLSASLHASLKQLETQAADQEVRFTANIQDGVFINGDQEKMHQVFLNLLLNAIQASPKDSTIDISLVANANRSAVLRIQDHGDGVADADIERIFDPFFTTKHTGSGLGLALVKSIVENHNGQVRVVSKPKQGACVILTLPVIEENA
jgi:signal transduction histidine kinase